jgi:predicted nuclease of restriction endonuclease-like RecB superfamily
MFYSGKDILEAILISNIMFTIQIDTCRFPVNLILKGPNTSHEVVGKYGHNVLYTMMGKWEVQEVGLTKAPRT